MATTFVGNVSATIRANMTPDAVLSNTSDDLVQTLTQAFANGTGANQAAQHWSDSRSLAATSETLDLAGSLTNRFGATVTFATIRAIVIRNKAVTAGFDLLVGAAGSNPFSIFGDAASDKLKVRAGGFVVITAPLDGYTVTNAAADALKIDAGANTVAYDIILIGT